MKYPALVIFILSLIILGSFSPASANAQAESVGTALSIPLLNQNVSDGSIINSTSKGYGLTTSAYDSNMYGVYTESPAIYLKNIDNPQSPVTTSGKSSVLVSTINGNIKINDFITSSTIPGVGEKVTRNGMILGTALESYSNSNQKELGKIMVAINPHFSSSSTDARTDLLTILQDASDPTFLSQLTALRYIIAAGIVLISFAIGFIYFGRVASRGVEALGRNPLAGRAIQFSLVLNLALIILIIVAGMGIGYMILVI
jgi:hypothetical protein